MFKQTAETNGDSPLKGPQYLFDDLEWGKGELHVSLTNDAAFEVDASIAASPCKVVFQTELLQLIQYAPQRRKYLR